MREAVLPEDVRASLGKTRGRKYWRSLDEYANTPEFEEMLHREFPRHASEWDGSVDRRRFLQLSGASLALAGLAGCTRQPIEKIVPYVSQPEEIVPGKPLYYATGHRFAGYANGVLVESHMGRPTKFEGNPDHPASLGKSDLYAQASILDLYDPDRSQAVTQAGKLRTWTSFADMMGPRLTAIEALQGEGLHILTGAVTSPTEAALLGQLLEKMPKARWYVDEPAGRDNAHRGARQAFGEPVATRYDLSQADVVVAIDADFLSSGPAAVRQAQDFAARRRVWDVEAVKQAIDAGEAGMNRLYSIESTPSNVSTVADHRLALKPTEVAHFVAALAAELGVPGAVAPAGFDAEKAETVSAVAADLEAHRGRGVIVVGDQVDPEVHVLAHAIHQHLGSVGSTVFYTEPVEALPPGEPEDATLAALVREIEAGTVETLFILGQNPVYSAPADLDFAAALEKVDLRIHLGTHQDETAFYSHWHLPQAHDLEIFFDGRSHDGTVTYGQPLIEPLYGGKSVADILAFLLAKAGVTSEDLVREHWQTEWEGQGDFEKLWRKALHDGFLADSALPEKAVTLDAAAVASAAQAVSGWSVGGLELAFRPDSTVFDGRYANNGWLQECPKAITRLTWDNALLMSPSTAREIGLGEIFQLGDQRGDAPVVTLTVGERSLELPVWLVPGHADGTLTLHLGYGREHCGSVGEGAGWNANRVRSAEAPWRVSGGVSVEPVGRRHLLASTQDHHSMEGRDLVMVGTLKDAVEHPEHILPHLHVDPRKTLMDEGAWEYDSYAWAMTIDLTACTGCNACVMACQAENNIPVVGKEQVAMGREMHWIRIDRYFVGEDPDHVTGVVQQPVICMQCEQAPCELVCPVAATVHSDEGLNDMVYNRCVGTRYCSNNCPYKVRRFNFFLYQDFETPSLQLGRNPDVTVRSRGVMEKCTYCVQRINSARIEAKREGRKIRAGEIHTACQQACPTDALLFGDQNNIKDPNDPQAEDWKILETKKSPLNYGLLAELGTRPRTTYLARVRNPNPALEPPADHGGGDHGSGDHASGDHGSGAAHG